MRKLLNSYKRVFLWIEKIGLKRPKESVVQESSGHCKVYEHNSLTNLSEEIRYFKLGRYVNSRFDQLAQTLQFGSRVAMFILDT